MCDTNKIFIIESALCQIAAYKAFSLDITINCRKSISRSFSEI